MIACRHIIYFVFNSITHSFSVLRLSIDSQREIPYLCAPMNYSLYIIYEANFELDVITKN